MGFVLSTIHKLVFEEFVDEGGECLEIRVKALTFGELSELRAADLTQDDEIEAFAKHLISWNLQNAGEDGAVTEVPATPEGVRSQDAAFILRLFDLWIKAITEVPAPLDTTSTSGPPFPEGSLPMEVLSPSPQS